MILHPVQYCLPGFDIVIHQSHVDLCYNNCLFSSHSSANANCWLTELPLTVIVHRQSLLVKSILYRRRGALSSLPPLIAPRRLIVSRRELRNGKLPVLFRRRDKPRGPANTWRCVDETLDARPAALPLFSRTFITRLFDSREPASAFPLARRTSNVFTHSRRHVRADFRDGRLFGSSSSEGSSRVLGFCAR